MANIASSAPAPSAETSAAAAPAPPSPSLARRQDLVRPLEERDIDAVARLFLSRFRRKGLAASESARAEVAAYMRQLYLEGPTSGDGVASMALIDANGQVGAFVGVVRMTYLLDGQRMTAGVNGLLMAADEAGNSLALVQLLRALHRRPFDLLVTDSANRASLTIGRAMKYHIHPLNSLEWATVFEPAAAALHKLSQKAPFMRASLLRPFARAADLAIGPALRRKLKVKIPGGWRDEAIDAQTFVEIAPRLLDGLRLRPQWSPRELGWLTQQAEQRRGAGPLHLHAVRDPAGRIAAVYAFFGEKGGVARVVHASAVGDGWGGLMANLIETARALGCIGAHGCAREGLMTELYAYPGLFFYYGGGTMVFSHRKDVMDAAMGSSTFFGGFAGDRWTRFASDEFGA